MADKRNSLKETASQTAGPYVHIGLAPGAAGFDIYDQELGWDIAGPNAAGARIRVEGTVVDGKGDLIKDALLEVWQANAAGLYAHPEGGGQTDGGSTEEDFRGWGRVIADFETGEWGFNTVKPGAVGAQAPHLSLWIVARGINTGLNTRLYFADEADANATDPVLNSIDPQDRRATLIAERTDRDGLPVYRFDITVQGDGETVFFDV